jgi:hypothetical protein
MGDCGASNMQQHQPSQHSFTWQRQFGGGGQTIPQQVARTPPPPTTNDAEVRQAREEALRKERSQQGRRATILAGATDRNQAMGSSQSGSGVGRVTLGG